MTIFRELLKIKTFREDQAELAVIKQRMVLAQANKKRDEAEEERDRFKKYAKKEEKRIYDELCKKVVRLRDIDDVRMQVIDLRDGEKKRENSLTETTEKRDQESSELSQAQIRHQNATRNKQKFVDLASIYAEEQIKELERKEDLEFEEVASISRDREDWGHQEEA